MMNDEKFKIAATFFLVFFFVVNSFFLTNKSINGRVDLFRF